MSLQFTSSITDYSLEKSLNKVSKLFSVKYTSDNLRHTVSLNSDFQDYIPTLKDPTKDSKYVISPSLLRRIIPKVKNSISYMYQKDNLDDMSAPSKGSSLQFQTVY